MPTGRRRLSRALIAVSAGAAATFALLSGPSSQAEPVSTPKIEQVRRQVAELQDQAEQATENANELGDDLTVITARLAGLQRDLVRQAAVVEQLRPA